MPTRPLTFVREAPWLDPSRARAYRLILALAMLGIAAGWVALSRNGIDPQGKPLGTDFLAF